MKAIANKSREKKRPYEAHGIGRGEITPYMRANARSFATPVDMLPKVLAARTGSAGLIPSHWWQMVLVALAAQ